MLENQLLNAVGYNKFDPTTYDFENTKIRLELLADQTYSEKTRVYDYLLPYGISIKEQKKKMEAVVTAFPVFMAVLIKEYELASRLIDRGYYALEPEAPLEGKENLSDYQKIHIKKDDLFGSIDNYETETAYITQLLLTDEEIPKELAIKIYEASMMCGKQGNLLLEYRDMLSNRFLGDNCVEESTFMGFGGTLVAKRIPHESLILSLADKEPRFFKDFVRSMSIISFHSNNSEAIYKAKLRYTLALMYVLKDDETALCELLKMLDLSSNMMMDIQWDCKWYQTWNRILSKMIPIYSKSDATCLALAKLLTIECKNMRQTLKDYMDGEDPFEVETHIEKLKKEYKRREKIFAENVVKKYSTEDFLCKIFCKFSVKADISGKADILQLWKKLKKEPIRISMNDNTMRSYFLKLFKYAEDAKQDTDIWGEEENTNVITGIIQILDAIDGFDDMAESVEESRKRKLFDCIMRFNHTELLQVAFEKQLIPSTEVNSCYQTAMLFHYYQLLPVLYAYK